MREYTLAEKIRWPLDHKIDHALGNIDQFYHTLNGKCYISFSGGKDSTVLWWMINKFTDMCGYLRLPAVFNDTTNEHLEILNFVKSFGDQVTWTRPKITFAQSLVKNGFPLVSKEQAQFISEAKTTKSDKLRNIRMNGVPKTAASGTKYTSGKIAEKWKYLVEEEIKITSKCCDVLKKDPSKAYEKLTGLSPFIGTTVGEGSLRIQQMNIIGSCNSFDPKRPKSKPLSIFTNKDIWEIIRANNIPYCSIYDDQNIEGVFVKGEERTGCAYCAFGLQFEEKNNTKFHRLNIREPKRYKSMMDKLGYRDAIHLVGIRLPDDPPDIQLLNKRTNQFNLL